MSIFRGVRVVVGVQEPQPVIGAPPGRQRLRMRNDAPAWLFVKTASGIRQFYLEPKADGWHPILEQGRNVKL